MLSKFITFEGGEGSGKSTQSALLYQSFINASLSSIHTREPGGTKGSEEIRSILVQGDLNKWEPMSELLLVMAARSEHINKVIKPSMSNGYYVICDRFIDSSIAYQGFAQGLGESIVKEMHDLVFSGLYPDLTFVFDVDPSEGISRALARKGKETRYENMNIEFHIKIREGFRKIVSRNPKRCIAIDAKLSIEEIHESIISSVNEKFSLFLKPIKMSSD